MTIPAAVLERFPTLDPEFVTARLRRPEGPARVIIDTDTANEIDDQYALAWVLLSPERMKLEGVTAEPFSFIHHREGMLRSVEILKRGGPGTAEEANFMGGFAGWAQRIVDSGTDPESIKFVLPDEGAELSYEEIIRVFNYCGVDPEGMVYRGSPAYLSDFDSPLETDAARFIIERARAEPAEPLYILAMGALTNIASALLMAPDIINNIVVVWTSAFPTYAPFCNRPSLNLIQDELASRLLFDCGVPHVYLPGYHVGAQLRISLPEMERFVKDKGAIGDYLHHLYTHNPLHAKYVISDPETKSWVIWDIINVAWMFDETFVSTHMTQAPVLDEDLYWQHPADRHPMLEAFDVDRDAIFEDFYRVLAKAP